MKFSLFFNSSSKPEAQIALAYLAGVVDCCMVQGYGNADHGLSIGGLTASSRAVAAPGWWLTRHFMSSLCIHCLSFTLGIAGNSFCLVQQGAFRNVRSRKFVRLVYSRSIAVRPCGPFSIPARLVVFPSSCSPYSIIYA